MRKWATLLVACAVLVGGPLNAAAAGLFAGLPTVRVTLNGQELGGDVPAVILEERTVLPVRAVAEALGLSVGWDPVTRTVVLSTPTASPWAPVPAGGARAPEEQARGSVMLAPAGPPPELIGALEALQRENEELRAEISRLMEQVAVTPQYPGTAAPAPGQPPDDPSVAFFMTEEGQKLRGENDALRHEKSQLQARLEAATGEQTSGKTESGFPRARVAEAQQLAKGWRQSVLLLKATYGLASPSGPDAPGATATAFLVQPDLVVTNEHNIENQGEHVQSVQLLSIDGQARTGQVLGWDKLRDIAVLRLDRPFDNTTPLRWGDESALNSDDPLLVIGHPGIAGNWVVSGGVFVRIRDNLDPLGQGREDKTLFTSAPASAGNSGGPILNMRGEVVAVLYGGEPMRDAITSDQAAPLVIESVLRTERPMWTTGTPSGTAQKVVQEILARAR